jgi:chemotaxis protein MotB
MSYANKRRERSSEDEGGGGSWMDTYGDLVTLLLCFFVLLFAFSSIDSAKWEFIVGAFSGSPVITIQVMDPVMAMEKPITLITTTSETAEEIMENTKHEIQQQEYDDFFELYEKVSNYITIHHMRAQIFVDFEAFIIIVRFGDNIFFNSGDAAILPDSQPILDHLINLFEENAHLYRMISIEGHTDNRPIHTAKYASNWELSAFRALNALHYILDSERIEVTKISATGYGEYHPVATNDTVDGRASNRRVDFVVQGIKTL